jgi:hypothetical protein
MGEKIDVNLKPNSVIFLDEFLWNGKFSFPNGEKQVFFLVFSWQIWKNILKNLSTTLLPMINYFFLLLFFPYGLQ